MKRVLTVQDLSCVGKCSLTVALPVLSAMGCAASALPTAVLSTHTGFPGPYVRSFTEAIVPIGEHWQSIGINFDAVSVGYLSDPEQAAQVEALLQPMDSLVVLDPVMGDHGRLYSGITEHHVAAVKRLCQRADYLLPNITEACHLTDIPYEHTTNPACYEELLAVLKMLTPNVVLTGVSLKEGNTGFMTGSGFVYQTEALPGHYHGTGDIFAAVFTGAMALGETVEAAATLAAGFVERVIAATGESSPFGVAFEPVLPWLWETLNEE